MHKSVKENFDSAIAGVLIIIENAISVISVIVLLFMLLIEMVSIVADPMAYLASPDSVVNYLHDMLNIVVGLEFVKLLMHLTPANILEVLVMAISRSIIVSHGNALDNLIGVACIVMLFATRRYLVPRQDMHHGLAEEYASPQDECLKPLCEQEQNPHLEEGIQKDNEDQSKEI